MDSFESFALFPLASEESPIHKLSAGLSIYLSEDTCEASSAALFNIESCRSRSSESQTDSQLLPMNFERVEAAAVHGGFCVIA
ncbi:hypothetical protein Moror_17093 [Moniliophthora roreri MCA 2997]|uniref:Pheromone n=2 Tax=Moniliophthora roreri TaxID=221103 RepID=V2X8L7_MONRO|nr:pheromone precursor Mr_Ph4.2 [Moniliophthora roreri]ESK88815.1 hypothetical protein Moror_17093 [Moniliophthora roreri MCA 2997]